MRSELPLPLAAHCDGWGQMSSPREKTNHKKQTPKHRTKNKQQYQVISQGFYDQARQQDYDMDWRLSQPPRKKIRKTDDSDVRGESALQTSPFLLQAERSNKRASKLASAVNHQFQLFARFGTN